MSEPTTCEFYDKIGVCRHGEKCSRKHIRPTHSKTIMMANLYTNPELDKETTLSKPEIKTTFEKFYKDIFIEASLIGEIEELTVCENHNDHLNGNVFIKFRKEDSALKARDNFSVRWYNSRPVYCELSPVHDFRDSTCRQHDISTCDRGGMCNFMHVKRPSRLLLRELRLSQSKYYKEQRRE